MRNRKLDNSTLFSIVVPVYNEEESLPLLFDRIRKVADSLPVSVEVVLVNDASKDRSLAIMQDFVKRDPRFRVADLSRNFGHQYAVSAALTLVRGHVVAIMDADLQDPPEILGALLERWADGVDIVYGQRRNRSRENRFKLYSAWLFYRVLSWFANVEIPTDTGDFRVVDRTVVDVVNKMPEQQKFLRGMFAWVGFRQEPFLYDRDARVAGATKYPLTRMLKLSADGILSFSVTPLRAIMLFGLAMTGLSFLSALYVLILRLTASAEFPPGVAGLFVAVLFMFGVNFICLGIIGEYLGRTFVNLQARPVYIIKQVYEHPQLHGDATGAFGNDHVEASETSSVNPVRVGPRAD